MYVRRNGPMLFWRIGRIGGSIYLAQSARADHGAKETRRAQRVARRAKVAALRQDAKWSDYWRSQALEARRILAGGY